MILFPQNPVWFSLKFINLLRNHDKCSYKPSIRQAIAICKLILSRFINRGVCNQQDFIEIAVVTTPIESQKIAKKVATKLFSYYNPPNNFQSSPINLGLLDGTDPTDLITEFDDNFDELDRILDDLNFLDEKRDTIEKIDNNWEVEYYSHYDEFFLKFFNQLQKEPYKTALKVVENNSVADFHKFKTPDDLLNFAIDILFNKINNLEPMDINPAKILELLDEIIDTSDKMREIFAAKLAKGMDINYFAQKIKSEFKNNFFRALDTLDFILKADVLKEKGRESMKTLFKELLENISGNVEDLFEATKTFGENLELEDRLKEQLIENSMDLPFQQAYKNLKSIDRYYGGDLLDHYLKKTKEKLEEFDSFKKIQDTLTQNPIKTTSWRDLMKETTEKEIEKIKKQNKGSNNTHQYLKDYTNHLIKSQHNCPEPTLKLQLNEPIHDSVNESIAKTPNKEHLSEFVEEFQNLGFSPDSDIIRARGKKLNMSSKEILRLIASDYEDLKEMVIENVEDYHHYRSITKKIQLQEWQVEELTKLSLKRNPPNLSALTALGEKNLGTVINSANKLGNKSMDMVLSSLGAGNGPDLLEQWFFSRHSIPANVKPRIKQIIKRIMIDLGIQSANSLIGTGNSGPLTENTVVPYQHGDEFDLIDLTETINNILESGKTINELTEEDFLVSKTSKGLRTIVLELDISGSMSGTKLAQMSLCTTMLIYAFAPEEIALSFFESNTHILKNIDEKVSLESIVDELLDIRARGGTCIRAALNWANNQFEKKGRSKSRLNVLFTDADIFDFEDSRKELEKIKHNKIKFVMVVPKFNYSPVMAKRLVKEANGVLLTLNQWRSFPKLISEIVTDKNY
jgi:Mg-chelatase subunit ChlD/uncharacterized protein YdhG (YjbR/CyaY superfamily)